MLSFDNIPSSKMQKLYYDYLLHPQDIQRMLDTTRDDVDRINGIIDQTILEVNASNAITTDSVREELDKLFDKKYNLKYDGKYDIYTIYNIYTKPASYLYEVGNYIMKMFDDHMPSTKGYSSTTDYVVQRDYLYDLFNSNTSGRTYQFIKTDSGDYNHSHLEYDNYKIYKRNENDKLVPVNSVKLHDVVRHVDLKFDVDRHYDTGLNRYEYRDNVDCKINLFRERSGRYEQKNNILIYTPDAIGENQSTLSVPIKCEKTLDPATNYRYSSDIENDVNNDSIISYDFIDGQYVLTPNKTLIYLSGQRDNYVTTESIPGLLSTNKISLVMQRIIQESDGDDMVFRLYRYSVPLRAPYVSNYINAVYSRAKDDVRLVLDYIDGYTFVWYIFSGERSNQHKDFLLYVVADYISDDGSIISNAPTNDVFASLLGFFTRNTNLVNIPTVTKMVGLTPRLYSVDWSVFTKTLQNNVTDIERYMNSNILYVSNSISFINSVFHQSFRGEDYVDYTNSTNIFTKNYQYKYTNINLRTQDYDTLVVQYYCATAKPNTYIGVYPLISFVGGDYPSSFYETFFGGLDSSGNFTSSSSILTIPSFYHYLTMKRLERFDGDCVDSVSAIKIFHTDDYPDTFFCAAIIGTRFELLINYRSSFGDTESRIYNTLLPVKMINNTDASIENVLNSYNENRYRKIKFYEYKNPSDSNDRKIIITTDTPYLFTITNYDCLNSEIPEKLVCTITYVNDKNTSEHYRLFELEDDIIFFPIRYSTYENQLIYAVRENGNEGYIKKSPYTLAPGEDFIEYVSMNNGRLKFFIDYNDMSIVSNNTDINTTFEVDYNYMPKDIFSIVCKRVKEITSTGSNNEMAEHDTVFRYGTYDGLNWFPMSTSNLSTPLTNTVKFASIGTLTSKDNDTRTIDVRFSTGIYGADRNTIMTSSSLVDIGFGVSLDNNGQKEIIKSFNKSLYGDKFSLTCVLDYTNILKPIIGIPFDNEFLSNVNTIELNLVLLNKVKSTIYLFNCYRNNIIYPEKTLPSTYKFKARIFVPTDLYNYYYNNRYELFRLDASRPKQLNDYVNGSIKIYDLGTFKKYLPSGDGSVSFDDIYDFDSLSGIEDNNEKFRNYVDDSRFIARIAFSEPTKLINIYPSVDPYKFGTDTISDEKSGFEKFLNNGVRNFNKFRVLISDVSNGTLEFIVDVNNRTTELINGSATDVRLAIYVNFLNTEKLDPESEEVRKELFPTVVSKQFLPFFISIIRNDPYSYANGSDAYYDMYIEIENNNDMQFRMHTTKYVASDHLTYDASTLITRAIETSEYMNAEIHNNAGNIAKKLLDSGQYTKGDIYYFVHEASPSLYTNVRVGSV